ncbi:MAG TPA: FAD-dependent monooxygenase [Hyphomicrobiaceae bacterium]|nr:FAD-dependent monooxygenase [Hyphomicrobiaceae bacterium]
MQGGSQIAIIGAGIGGLALAGLLTRQGAKVTVYEQAAGFERLGAGIQMSPNAMHVLRALGLEPLLRRLAFQPPAWTHRVWDTGEHLGDLTFGAEAEQRYGAPYLLMHRGDLHAAILSAVPTSVIRFNKKLSDIVPSASAVDLVFADGSRATADGVVGADGVHSRVREILLGPERPLFTGRVAHRTVFPAALLGEFAVDTCTKWWGPDRHIVVYPVNPRRDEIYFVTSVPDPHWDVESWSQRGEMAEVVEALAGFHSDVQRLLAACPQVHKWALFERDPLARWSEGAIVLLGDACHPMTPYMAQGAANALEDAAVLSRCLQETADPAVAFKRYEATRLERTARIQLTSRQNTWGKQAGDPGWVYGYDAWATPIAQPLPVSA